MDKEKIKNMFGKKAFVGLIVVAIILISAPLLAESYLTKNKTMTFNTTMKVVESPAGNKTMGVDAGINLNYGKLSKGFNVTKFINVSSRKKSLVTLKSEGNISEYIHYNETHFFKGENQIPVEVKARDLGFYTGKITLNAQTPKTSYGEPWIELKSLFF